MEMKFYSPLTAEFFPDEPDWEDESYNEYEGYPMDGHDLLQYADAVDEAVKKDIADFNGDLMQYYHEDDSVRQKVISAVPSVEIHGNKLCGCLNVELRESLNEGEQAVLCDYISGQYSDGWGEGFEQRDIRVEEGTLAVHFWQEDGFKMTPTFEKTQEQVQMTQRPKMKLLGEDGNIFAIMGRASLLLKNAGQSDKAKEMLFFAADDHGVTVAPAVAAQRAGGAEIPHRVDGKGAAIRPGDGAGLHIPGGVKLRGDFYIHPLRGGPLGGAAFGGIQSVHGGLPKIINNQRLLKLAFMIAQTTARCKRAFGLSDLKVRRMT